jgi:alkylation response protein AidB-like acyl-CoA dehydrogenase
MWISGGEHDITPNIVHLVLAKVADPDGQTQLGTRGISLFIVPKLLPDGTRNDATWFAMVRTGSDTAATMPVEAF